VTFLVLSKEPAAEQETEPNSGAFYLYPLNYTSRWHYTKRWA